MEVSVKSSKREEFIDITKQVEEAVEKLVSLDNKLVCNKKARAVFLYCPHTTCALLVNEGYDEDVASDILKSLRTLVKKEGWKHAEGNSDAHIKSVLVGNERLIPLSNFKLALGKWQKIFLVEFDGPRERKVRIEIL